MADPMTLDQRLATLAAMTDALPDPTVIVDRRSVVLHRNAAARRIGRLSKQVAALKSAS